MSFLRHLFLGVCIFLTSCGDTPNDRKVEADFLKQHPTWEVLSVNVGEGDASAAYYHIRYKRPGESQVYEEIWQYLNEGQSVWKLSHQERVK
jgi:hypothetical protein